MDPLIMALHFTLLEPYWVHVVTYNGKIRISIMGPISSFPNLSIKN